MNENNSSKIAKTPNESRAQSFWEMVRFALLALLIVIPIRIFVAQPFIVSGNSMIPTFYNNEYLIIDELSYRFHEPVRDDVVVFRYPKDPTKFFIKRIIGLPGDTVTIDGGKVTIKNTNNPEGFVMEEPYVKNRSSNQLSVTLKQDEYFVMGDNRIASSDSRIWGVLPRNLIVGRAFLRLLPLSSISYLPGAYSLNNI